MRWLSLIMLVGLLGGCNSAPAPEAGTQGAQSPAPTTDPNTSGSVSQSGGGESNGVSPMTSAPIPNAPVSGSESLQGGGSNVGSVAKDRAKQAASQASTPNMGTGGEGE